MRLVRSSRTPEGITHIIRFIPKGPILESSGWFHTWCNDWITCRSEVYVRVDKSLWVPTCLVCISESFKSA